MKISDIITSEILRMLNESDENIAEIQRNDFASLIGCAPSQINYVLSSRFTPEHAFSLIQDFPFKEFVISVKRDIAPNTVNL